MRHIGVVSTVIFAFAVSAALPLPAAALSVSAAAAPTASITAMPSPDTAVLSVGANAGLAVGMELKVFQNGQEAGRIVLTQVGTSSATGRVASASGFTVRVMDTVALTAAASAATPPSPAPRSPVPAKQVVAPARSVYGEHANDMIPWERWEYIALSSLAADGLVAGYSARDFQATRTFTRGELAEITARAMTAFAAGAGSDRDEAFLRRLSQEFRLQEPVKKTQAALDELDLPRASSKQTKLPQIPGLSLYGGPRLVRFEGDNSFRMAGRVGGIYDLSANAYAVLSLTNLHRLTSALPKAFTAVDVATINARLWGADWELGKTYWSSGPSYAGDGLLSDNAPGMWMLKGRKNLSLGANRKFTLTQLYGSFADNDQTKYYGLRRIEARVNKRMDLGLGEAYVSTKAPNPLSLIVPYYAYQRLAVFHQGVGGHGGSATNNDTFNYMAQADLFYRITPKMNTYFELILDDISAPSSLGVGNVPRKLAWIWGMHFPHLMGGRAEGRFEIYNSDRETYLGIAPQVGWSEKDLLLGSPFGPNTQAFFGRLDYRFSNKLKGILQLRDAVQYHNGNPDMGDRFELAMTAAYDMKPNQSISVRWIPQRLRGQGYTIRPNALELMGTVAY
ncbi:MAG TPA: capsule assembly Wzi family protein [Armatimonadota bacterium]|jgi:hypothetical protein